MLNWVLGHMVVDDNKRADTQWAYKGECGEIREAIHRSACKCDRTYLRIEEERSRSEHWKGLPGHIFFLGTTTCGEIMTTLLLVETYLGL